MLNNLLNNLKKRYYAKAGYQELIKVALPLMISSGAFSLLMFIDRIFVSWYSADALAAAMPAGALNFAISSFFLGTALYVGTFVSQYNGAGNKHMIGPILWQGIYFSVFGACILLLFVPLSPYIFSLFDHDPAVISHEIVYFQALCFGLFPMNALAVLGAFYSGRGITKPVMWVNIYMLLINTPLDYLLIFGIGPFPELGILGAGISTVISQFSAFTLLTYMVLRKKNRDVFNTLAGWRPDLTLIKKLLKFGLPSGVHMCVEITGFTVFSVMVGFLGKEIQAASNIAFQIDVFGFIIIHSVSIAVSIKVGNYIGSKEIRYAERSVFSGLQLGFFVVVILSSMYVFFPKELTGIFGMRAEADEFGAIQEISIQLLRFVAVYVYFDMVQLIFSSAIKGAGDTHFVMKYLGLLTIVLLVVPSIVVIKYLDGTVYAMWIVLTVFVLALALVYTLRFFGGKWKTMSVIEEEPLYIEQEHL